MSPLGIKRLVAIVLVLSPWVFIPGLFKDIIFVIAGVLLFIGTLDLRKKSIQTSDHNENESMPREAFGRSVSTPKEKFTLQSDGISAVTTKASA